MADGAAAYSPHSRCIACGHHSDDFHADGLCWACTRAAEYDPIPRGANPGATDGPCSNTGQNGEEPTRSRRRPTKPRASLPRAKGTPSGGALIDYLSVTIPDAQALIEEVGEQDFAQKVVHLLLGRVPLLATEFTGRGFQGYENSALIVGPGGQSVGFVGIGGNNGTLHVTLSGAGCTVITDWHRVQRGCEGLGAHITRCDAAFDDYEGALFNPRELNVQILAGTLRIRTAGAGQPPKTRFIDDHGCGTGVSLYAGLKGHKELCIYEKGIQLGDRSSPWVRVEVRWWSKRQEIPLALLTSPVAYMRAAYNVCEAIPSDLCERIKTERVKAEATVAAWTRHMQRQWARSVRILHRSLGEGMHGFLTEAIANAASGLPQRFRGMSEEALTEAIRTRLSHVGSRDPVGALA